MRITKEELVQDGLIYPDAYLSSAQPEQRSFSCGQENDLISRKAAIDALGKEGLITAMVIIDRVPSAQPKAIRPKFVAEDRYIKNHFTTYPHCPKCNYELETGDCYCKVCGCHIDWSEDDVPGNGL